MRLLLFVTCAWAVYAKPIPSSEAKSEALLPDLVSAAKLSGKVEAVKQDLKVEKKSTEERLSEEIEALKNIKDDRQDLEKAGLKLKKTYSENKNAEEKLKEKVKAQEKECNAASNNVDEVQKCEEARKTRDELLRKDIDLDKINADKGGNRLLLNNNDRDQAEKKHNIERLKTEDKAIKKALNDIDAVNQKSSPNAIVLANGQGVPGAVVVPTVNQQPSPNAIVLANGQGVPGAVVVPSNPVVAAAA